MARIAWATDIHLDHLQTEGQIVSLAESIRRQGPEGVVLTGDISVAGGLVLHLSIMERVLQVPIYFVLGNHDYWGGSVEGLRKQMKELTNLSGFLKYLPTTPYVTLTRSTALVGHDGWYDALYGDPMRSRFIMRDWDVIQDFRDLPATDGGVPVQHRIIPLCRELAHAGVQHVHEGIKGAVRYHKTIVVATHFPPWEETHVFQGRRGDAGAMPWYTSKMMGDMLLSAARSFPNVDFTVLAGHTHGKVTHRVMDNLVCHVGHSEYGQPTLADVFDVP